MIQWLNLVYFVHLLIIIIMIHFFFGLFRAIPQAYEGSQARVRIGAVAASLHYSQAMSDPSPVCDLHHSSQKCWILSPPSEARD